MAKRDTLLKLFGISTNTYYVWKRDSRPIVRLIEESFSEEELIVYLDNDLIPPKIDYANNVFMYMSHVYTHFFYDNKAFFDLFFSCEEFIIEFRKSNNAKNTLIQLILKYSKCSTHEFDVALLIEKIYDKEFDALIYYIRFNIENDFVLYYQQLTQDNNEWLIYHHKLRILASKKNIYFETFGICNGERNLCIEEKLEHPHPKLFTYYGGVEKLKKEYIAQTEQLLDSLKKNTDISSLKKYSLYE